MFVNISIKLNKSILHCFVVFFNDRTMGKGKKSFNSCLLKESWLKLPAFQWKMHFYCVNKGHDSWRVCRMLNIRIFEIRQQQLEIRYFIHQMNRMDEWEECLKFVLIASDGRKFGRIRQSTPHKKKNNLSETAVYF